MRKTTPSQDFIRGIWNENPVLIQMLGLCPALAVTNSVANALAMSAATFFVICCSSVLISTFKKFIPHEVRISSYILVIATFVTLADMILQAYDFLELNRRHDCTLQMGGSDRRHPSR